MPSRPHAATWTSSSASSSDCGARSKWRTSRARLDGIQATHLAAFVEARPELIGRYGIAGFARIMDSFAAGERTLNRAWSAAADGVLPASLEALQLGMAHLAETQRRIAEQ